MRPEAFAQMRAMAGVLASLGGQLTPRKVVEAAKHLFDLAEFVRLQIANREDLWSDEQRIWTAAVLRTPGEPRRLVLVTSDMCRIIEEAVLALDDGGRKFVPAGPLAPSVDGNPIFFFESPLELYGTGYRSLACKLIPAQPGQLEADVPIAGLFGCGEDNDRLVFGIGSAAASVATVIDNLLNESNIAEERPARVAPRNAKERRRGRPSEIRVIDLRSRSRSSAKQVSEARKLDMHRWIVRGHWRNQACGPGRSERRMIYIQSYVKGPDGAPLLTGAKVYRWR